MIVFLNGRLVPAHEATVSIFDRGFLYGDGLFETIRIYAGRPFLWNAHIARLERGAAALQLRIAADAPSLLLTARDLLRRNGLDDAILRVTVSRGQGRRGYSPTGADHPTLALTLTPACPLEQEPELLWRLHTAQARLPARDPFAAFKTASKLLQVMARAEAEAAGADEALLLNTDGHLAETAATNLFWSRGEAFFTPRLEAGALAGVTRALIIDLLGQRGWSCEEVFQGRPALDIATGVFLTLSSAGIVEATHLDGRPLPRDPRLPQLRAAYRDAVRRQCMDDSAD